MANAKRLPVVYVDVRATGIAWRGYNDEEYAHAYREPAPGIDTVPFEPLVPRCKTCRWLQMRNATRYRSRRFQFERSNRTRIRLPRMPRRAAGATQRLGVSKRLREVVPARTLAPLGDNESDR